MKKSEINSIIKELDFNSDGSLNFSEFLIAVINLEHFLTKEKAMAVFKQFDLDNTDQIDAENVRETLGKMGFQINKSKS